MFDKDNFIKYVSGVTAGRISKGNEDFEYLWDEHNKQNSLNGTRLFFGTILIIHTSKFLENLFYTIGQLDLQAN